MYKFEIVNNKEKPDGFSLDKLNACVNSVYNAVR